ncbi:unnamed protein product [Ophioblennius macclurei]
MTSIHAMREFVGERLTVAAGEIFTVFENIILQYEQEILRQQKLLEMNFKPQVKLHRIDFRRRPNLRERKQFHLQTNYCPEEEESESEDELEEPGLQSEEDEEDSEPPQSEEELEEPEYLPPQGKKKDPEPPQIEKQEDLGTSQQREERVPLRSDGSEAPFVEEQGYDMDPNEIPDSEQFLSRISMIQILKHCVNSEANRFRPDSADDVVLKKHHCEVCGKRFLQKIGLERHASTHSDVKPHSCEICGKSFRLQRYLDMHASAHSGGKVHACKTCTKSFSELKLLEAHIRKHRGKKSQPCNSYPCKTCGETFTKLLELRAHRKTHKVHVCKVCGKHFSHIYTLTSHMKLHPEEMGKSADVEPIPCRTTRKANQETKVIEDDPDYKPTNPLLKHS